MSGLRDGLTKQCDCAPERWAKCPHGWHGVKRIKGTPVWRSLDKEAKKRGLPLPRLRAEAETLWALVAHEIETGKPNTSENTFSDQPAALTFDQAWPSFATTTYADVETAPAEHGRCRMVAAVVLPGGRFGDLPVAALTEDHIEAVYAAVTSGKRNGTKHKYRRILVRFCRWAVRKGHLAVNPISADTRIKAGKMGQRSRRVKPDEEQRLLRAADQGRYEQPRERLWALIIVAVDCALRVGELLALQWRDVLWAERRVFIRAVAVGARKNRKPRRVPMTPRVLQALQALAATNPTGTPWAPMDYVFGDAVGRRVTSVYRLWAVCVLLAHEVVPKGVGYQSAEVQAALPRLQEIDLHFHDLRREGALRWYHDKGYTLNAIAKLLGHSNLNTLKVYLGIDEEDALAEAEAKVAAEWAAAGPRVSKPLVNRGSGRLLRHRSKTVSLEESGGYEDSRAVKA
jgi:integrase